MPFYDIKNNITGEIEEKFMSVPSLSNYLLNNPEYSVVIGSIPICDPVRIGVRKLDSGFKEVLQKIKRKTPGADFDKFSSQI